MEQPVILRNACGGSKLIHAHAEWLRKEVKEWQK